MSKRHKLNLPRNRGRVSNKEWRRREARTIKLRGTTNFGSNHAGYSRPVQGGLPSLGKKR
jgi:hypothetical protein